MTAVSAVPRAWSRRAWRVLLRGVGWLVALTLALALGFTLYAVGTLPPLQPWHTEVLHEEFDAHRHAQLDFAGYRRLEDRLFAELRAKTEAWARDGLRPGCRGDDCAEAAEVLRNSRFEVQG